MQNKKILYSFDKQYKAEVFWAEPDRYEEIEKLSKSTDELISLGSNLSYNAAGFGDNTLEKKKSQLRLELL